METSSPLSVKVMSHLYELGLKVVRVGDGVGVGGAKEERSESEGWPEDKKRAVSYSSDSNLDVNCRLMSQWSRTLLGNHGGIQENDARKKLC